MESPRATSHRSPVFPGNRSESLVLHSLGTATSQGTVQAVRQLLELAQGSRDGIPAQGGRCSHWEPGIGLAWSFRMGSEQQLLDKGFVLGNLQTPRALLPFPSLIPSTLLIPSLSLIPFPSLIPSLSPTPSPWILHPPTPPLHPSGAPELTQQPGAASRPPAALHRNPGNPRAPSSPSHLCDPTTASIPSEKSQKSSPGRSRWRGPEPALLGGTGAAAAKSHPGIQPPNCSLPRKKAPGAGVHPVFSMDLWQSSRKGSLGTRQIFIKCQFSFNG